MSTHRWGRVFSCWFVTLGLVASSFAAGTVWAPRDGDTLLSLNVKQLAERGVRVTTTAPDGTAYPAGAVNELAIAPSTTAQFATSGGAPRGFAGGAIVHDSGLVLSTDHGSVSLPGLTLTTLPELGGDQLAIGDAAGAALLSLDATKVGFDRAAGLLLVEAGALTVTGELAAQLGDKSLAGVSIGSLSVQTTLDWLDGEAPYSGPPGRSGWQRHQHGLRQPRPGCDRRRPGCYLQLSVRRRHRGLFSRHNLLQRGQPESAVDLQYQ